MKKETFGERLLGRLMAVVWILVAGGLALGVPEVMELWTVGCPGMSGPRIEANWCYTFNSGVYGHGWIDTLKYLIVDTSVATMMLAMIVGGPFIIAAVHWPFTICLIIGLSLWAAGYVFAAGTFGVLALCALSGQPLIGSRIGGGMRF